MAKTPPMRTREFNAALKRHGMRWTGFMGYVELGGPQRNSASVLNVGAHAGYRAWLAFLLKKQEEMNERLEAKNNAA